MRLSRLSLPFVILTLAVPGAARAQSAYDSTAFAALHWREIGIFRGGRSVAVAGSASRHDEYWMGTTGGGVYKTTDGGHTWRPSGEATFGGTVGSIAVSESNPDIVYVGTGEYPLRGNTSHGDGVFRTTDAGKTWTSLGLAETQQIARVRVHPTDPDIAYVAALGHAFGPNRERGIYKTTDGGAPGPRCSSGTTPPGHRTSRWTRPTPRCSTPPSGRCSARLGPSAAAGGGAASSRPPTAARTGPRSPPTAACRAGSGGTSASPSPRPGPAGCGRSSRRIPAACTAPTMAARRGRG